MINHLLTGIWVLIRVEDSKKWKLKQNHYPFEIKDVCEGDSIKWSLALYANKQDNYFK